MWVSHPKSVVLVRQLGVHFLVLLLTQLKFLQENVDLRSPQTRLLPPERRKAGWTRPRLLHGDVERGVDRGVGRYAAAASAASAAALVHLVKDPLLALSYLLRALLEPLPVVVDDGGESAYRMTDFMGDSSEVASVSERVARLRQKRSTVLIYGESGTGKELVARALHFDGRHRNAPFIPLHCGAIAPELVESELFGHEKGAFTGAQSASQGLFRAADGGTIFLDEIAETSPSVQVKLLRVLQRGEIRPVGANQPRIVDVRIIAATNRDLLELVQEGKFREDLYYRLEVVTLLLPPLRDRLTDLRILADYFLRVGNRRHERDERPVLGFSKGAMDRLMAYSWPGNVRELENVIEGALALDVGEIVRENDLPERIRKGSPGIGLRPVQRSAVAMPSGLQGGGVVEPASDLRARRDAADRDAISQALRDTAGDKGAAAKQLGMARSTFYRRLKELGL